VLRIDDDRWHPRAKTPNCLSRVQRISCRPCKMRAFDRAATLPSTTRSPYVHHFSARPHIVGCWRLWVGALLLKKSQERRHRPSVDLVGPLDYLQTSSGRMPDARTCKLIIELECLVDKRRSTLSFSAHLSFSVSLPLAISRLCNTHAAASIHTRHAAFCLVQD
jgi:hypothetical protein